MPGTGSTVSVHRHWNCVCSTSFCPFPDAWTEACAGQHPRQQQRCGFCSQIDHQRLKKTGFH